MKKLSFVLVPLMATVGSVASAAGTAMWDGVSLGAYIGNAHGNSNLSTTVGSGNYFTDPIADGPGAIEGAGKGSRGSNNFIGGVSIGYGKQYGSLFVGGDLDYTNFNRDVSHTSSSYYPCCAASGFGFGQRMSISSDWIIGARTRLGYANAHALTYVTAGLAASDLTVRNAWVDSYGAQARSSRTNLKLGWTAGIGYEHMLANNWSIKSEYLYTKFGHVSSSPGAVTLAGAPYTSELQASGNLTVQMLSVGLNKRW